MPSNIQAEVRGNRRGGGAAVTLVRAELTAKIVAAFDAVKYPGDARIVASDEGSEPECVTKDFIGLNDWRSIDSGLLDQSPHGLSTALNFFSREAFQFYLPAYLLADIDGRLKSAAPVHVLTQGFEDFADRRAINPKRYGEKSSRDFAVERCSIFSNAQAEAITAYLEYKLVDADADDRPRIIQALSNYWHRRGKAASL